MMLRMLLCRRAASLGLALGLGTGCSHEVESPKVTLDVGNYRSQQRDALLQKAMEAAEKVMREDRDVLRALAK